jgi:hypothetical protein
MSKFVVLSGHGSWDPQDGWITLPQNNSVHFFVKHGKVMRNDKKLDTDAAKGIRPTRTIVETVSGGTMVRNYRLSKPTGGIRNIKRCSTSKFVVQNEDASSPLLLSELLDHKNVLMCEDIYWHACRTVLEDEATAAVLRSFGRIEV